MTNTRAGGWILAAATCGLFACSSHDDGPSDAERGAAYVAKRGCANCHQSSAPGSGVLSGNETALLGRVHALNLTPDRTTGLGLWTDDQVARAIRDGFDLGGAPLCLQMPRFSRMSDHEVLAIVAYLRSLPPVHHDLPQSVCPPIRPDPDSGVPDTSDVGPPDAPTDITVDTAADTDDGDALDGDAADEGDPDAAPDSATDATVDTALPDAASDVDSDS